MTHRRRRLDTAELQARQRLEKERQRFERAQERIEEERERALRKLESEHDREARRADRHEHGRDPSRTRPRGRHGRGHRASRRSAPGEARGRSRLTPEERAYREAKRRADLKMSVAIHGVTYASVLLMLLVVAGFRPAVIVGVTWGTGFAIHYFIGMVAPRLRERWIHDQVSPEVARGVSSERRAIETRHVRSLEDLSASIAHEIRNPVTAAKSLIQQMGEDPVSEENIEFAGVALQELDRVERSISHLLRFARDEELDFQPVEMQDVVDSALDTFRDRIERLGVEVERQIDESGTMRADPEKLRRVLINLVGNALDALEDSGVEKPRLEVMSGANLAGTDIWVRVRDNGRGIDPQTLQKIFDPFYTTKEQGTGLGLALSKKVVDSHGGSLEVLSSPGEGSEFVLTFPRNPTTGGQNG